MTEQVADAVAGIMGMVNSFGHARARSHFMDPDWNGDREAERTKRAIESALTAIVRERDLQRPVVMVARDIQRALGERPVDLTNETRWELDPVLLNALCWNLNALDDATAPPDGEQDV